MQSVRCTPMLALVGALLAASACQSSATPPATPAAQLRVEVLPVTPLQTNCYIVWNTATHTALVIDPGGDADGILSLLTKHGLALQGIALTHNHFDHAGAAAALQQRTRAPIYAHADQVGFHAPELATDLTGLVIVRVKDGDAIKLGDFALQILDVPGHAPGSLCFYTSEPPLAFTGDLLFRGNVGRTDLPGSSPAALRASLAKLVQRLRPATRILPGHGEETTLADERAHNHFLAE